MDSKTSNIFKKKLAENVAPSLISLHLCSECLYWGRLPLMLLGHHLTRGRRSVLSGLTSPSFRILKSHLPCSDDAVTVPSRLLPLANRCESTERHGYYPLTPSSPESTVGLGHPSLDFSPVFLFSLLIQDPSESAISRSAKPGQNIYIQRQG